jgi:hypothetical protein
MVWADGSAFVVDEDSNLLQVQRNGRSHLIARQATGVLAVDRADGVVYFTQARGGTGYAIVAWDPGARAPIARHRFQDASICCDHAYAVIRGTLADGSVIVDSLDWVRLWRIDVNEFEPYPLSGASAVRALSVGGPLLLVRDEHHSVADIELRTARRPLLAGIRMRGVNAGMLSPDGRTLAAFSGARPPFVAPTSALGIKTHLRAVGPSTTVIDAMWDSNHALLLQMEAPRWRGTLLIRCETRTGSCTRLPGDRAGPHLLPDGQSLVPR